MLQEIDIFEVAHAWQIDALALRTPAWIGGRDWKECQQLLELYERAELPHSVQQAALEKLLATGYIRRLTSPRTGDLCRIIDQFRPSYIRDAVNYLSNAMLPFISPDAAIDVLARLNELAA